MPNEASKVRKCVGMMMSEMNWLQGEVHMDQCKGLSASDGRNVSAARWRGEGRERMVIEVDRLGSLQLWGPSVQD